MKFQVILLLTLEKEMHAELDSLPILKASSQMTSFKRVFKPSIATSTEVDAIMMDLPVMAQV
jgi:hypothetical protein